MKERIKKAEKKRKERREKLDAAYEGTFERDQKEEREESDNNSRTRGEEEVTTSHLTNDGH